MTQPPRYRLTDAEKDALLERQARLIEAQAAQIAALLARIEALEAERVYRGTDLRQRFALVTPPC